tara:strand:- start:42812 stop:43495 length:684 start_codon:yes stop_codon:yes gene_type:complete
MNKKILGISFLIITLIFILLFKDYFTLEVVKEYQVRFNDFIDNNSLLSMAIYFFLYVIVTALSIPGAAVITLLGAALFGFWKALFLISFASSIGATLAFLISRYLLKDWVQNKFGNKLDTINKGIEDEGSFYLFSLRLIPIMPFFLINILFGLTNISVKQFYIISQLGMLLGTAVYVNAGKQLSEINSLSGIVSPEILLSFVLLGLFPLIAKKIINRIKSTNIKKEI